MKYYHKEDDVYYHLVMTNTNTKTITKTKTEKVPRRMGNVCRLKFPVLMIIG